jgi:parvulin-like peptidyl-prolyl isomerase
MPLQRSLLFVVALGLVTGCADLTSPASTTVASGAPAETPAAPAPEVTTARPVRPAGDAPPRPSGERIRASHILFAYQGAMRAKQTRSKEEAQKLATQAAGRIKGGADFASLAKALSDDEVAKQKGGDLGSFDKGSMTKKFSDAAFALPVNGVSDVVETEFGFHIIKRTE